MFFFFFCLCVLFFNNCTGFNHRRWELLCPSTKRRQKKVNQKKKATTREESSPLQGHDSNAKEHHRMYPNRMPQLKVRVQTRITQEATQQQATALTGTSEPEYTSCSVVCRLTISSSSPLLAMIFPASNSGIALFHPSATPHSYKLCVKPPSLREKKTPLHHDVQHTLLFFFPHETV